MQQKILNQNIECFLHTEPVLHAFALSRCHLQVASLTQSQIHLWTKHHTKELCEADYEHVKQDAPSGSIFVDMVETENMITVADKQGKLHVYVLEDYQFKLIGSVNSIDNKEIIDICYRNHNLFVVHKGGLLKRFTQWPNITSNNQVDLSAYHTNGKWHMAQPIKLKSNCNRIEIYSFQNEKQDLPDLLLCKEGMYITVYAYDWKVLEKDQPLVKCGYVSEQLDKPDIGAMYSTDIEATRDVVLVGNRAGYVTAWVATIGQSTNAENKSLLHSYNLEFTPIVSYWQHGKAIRSMTLCYLSCLTFSFDKAGCCVVMDIKNNLVVEKFICHHKAITSSQILKKDGIMITASEDFTVKMWRIWVPQQQHEHVDQIKQ